MQFYRIAKLTSVAIVVIGAVYADALASGAVTIRYNLRQDPDDPSSPVIRTIALDLSESQTNGNSIGWSVLAVTISEVDQNGQPQHVWIDATPDVDTPDGLWWIEHADPQNLQRSEFVEPPLLQGTGAAQDPADADLDYSMDGAQYNAPPGGPPFEVTGALDYTCTLAGSPEPLAAGTGEPVEIPETDDWPVG